MDQYGTGENYWKHSLASGYDLSRGAVVEETKSMLTHRGEVKVGTKRTALVVIDMQNYFLHPSIRSHLPGLLAAQQLLKLALPAARSAGIKIIWCNWGLTDQDLIDLPPCHASSFGALPIKDNTSRGFGSEMGTIDGHIPAGRLLFRETWNAQLYGDLQTSFEEGEKRGEDVWIHKDRMSGMWGARTELEDYLVEQGITTLMFAGVNTDQCVLGTLIDAHSKGYDTILLKDCCGTVSPDACRIATEYNSEKFGFSLDAADFAAMK